MNGLAPKRDGPLGQRVLGQHVDIGRKKVEREKEGGNVMVASLGAQGSGLNANPGF